MVVCGQADWRDFTRFRFCIVHELKFSAVAQCPKFSRAVSSGFVDRQARAKALLAEGKTHREIASEFGVTRQAVGKMLSATKRKSRRSGSLRIRLHNEEFSCTVGCEYAQVHGKIKNKGKNLEYKLIKSEIHHIKIHKNHTMTVRFLEDIVASSTDETIKQADVRLLIFVSNFWVAGVTIPVEMRLINRHFGLLGSAHAGKMIDERRLIVVRDPVDQKVRLRLDQSVPPAEIDTEHVEHGKSDMDYWQKWHEDITLNKPLLPSQVQALLMITTKNQEEFSENLKKHLGVLDAMNTALEDISKAVKRLPKAK